MTAPIVRRFQQLESYHPPHHTGTTNRRILGRDETPAGISVVRGTLDAAGGADYHYHRHSDQILFVIDGSCRVDVGGESFDIGKNDTMVLPRGVPHGVEVTSRTPLELHITYAPALRPDDTTSVERPRKAPGA